MPKSMESLIRDEDVLRWKLMVCRQALEDIKKNYESICNHVDVDRIGNYNIAVAALNLTRGDQE